MVAISFLNHSRFPANGTLPVSQPVKPGCIILSFDVEEHHRIEAAAGLEVPPAMRAHYRARLGPPTTWLLELLDRHAIKATFFVVGKITEHNPGLVRAIHRAGHEVACHGWDHQSVQHFTPKTFQEDVHRSKDILEQLTGKEVVGYRAPTFSIIRQTAWAIEVLAELGMRYDSSIFPVRHDRYGIPDAPRTPFLIRVAGASLLELPPATLRLSGANVPVGGGGYFRMLPLFVLEHALRRALAADDPSVMMLYFHPWEFDPQQARLPLGPLNRFRTYVGIHRSRARFAALLARGGQYSFVRAVDAANLVEQQPLPSFELAR